ncbi:hypothetical protein E2542_SST18838 [Spatholobus suberectus]|nr:hypothetical protein E2542_SST18838 [Spatholobus suberectus]
MINMCHSNPIILIAVVTNGLACGSGETKAKARLRRVMMLIVPVPPLLKHKQSVFDSLAYLPLAYKALFSASSSIWLQWRSAPLLLTQCFYFCFSSCIRMPLWTMPISSLCNPFVKPLTTCPVLISSLPKTSPQTHATSPTFTATLTRSLPSTLVTLGQVPQVSPVASTLPLASSSCSLSSPSFLVGYTILSLNPFQSQEPQVPQRQPQLYLR